MTFFFLGGKLFLIMFIFGIILIFFSLFKLSIRIAEEEDNFSLFFKLLLSLLFLLLFLILFLFI